MNSTVSTIGLIVGLACIYPCGMLMEKKGRSKGAGFALGFFLGIIGLIICAVLRPKNGSTGSTGANPYAR